MNQEIPAFPLCWPDRVKRTAPQNRVSSQFKTSLAGAIKNVHSSLRLFASDSGKRLDGLVISSNVTLGSDNPTDPGVSVWFMWDGLQVCIPIDRYRKVHENLQAIHHVMEARRVELRHGGVQIVRASFTGFMALPAPRSRLWWEVMGISQDSSPEDIKARYRQLAAITHPDKGGSADAFSELGAAYKQAQEERGAA